MATEKQQTPAVNDDQAKAMLQMTPEQLQAFVTGIIAEVKKPNEEELEAKEERKLQKERFIKGKLQARRDAEMQLEADRMRQANCSHKKEKGENAFHGQVCSDGMFHALCVICQKEVTFKPRPEQIGAV